MLRNAIVDSSLKSIQMYLMVQSNKLLKNMMHPCRNIFKRPFFAIKLFKKCDWISWVRFYFTCFFCHLVLLNPPPPQISVKQMSMSILTWKGVNTVHIAQMLSPAQLSGAQLCSGGNQQPGFCSVQADSASEVAQRRRTEQVTLAQTQLYHTVRLPFVRTVNWQWKPRQRRLF